MSRRAAKAGPGQRCARWSCAPGRIEDDGTPVSSAALRRHRCFWSAFLVYLGLQAAGAGERTAAPRRVRACDRRHLDALHQRAVAEYRCRDRTRTRRYGGMHRLGPSLFRVVRPSAAAARLVQDGDELFARLARPCARCLRPGSARPPMELSTFHASAGCRREKTRTRALPSALEDGPA